MKKANKILALMAFGLSISSVSFFGFTADNTQPNSVKNTIAIADYTVSQQCREIDISLKPTRSVSRSFVPQFGGCGQRPKPKFETLEQCFFGVCLKPSTN